MDFSLVRVDNRLVHGQILEAWLPYTKAASIIIADDDVAGDFFRETVIKMAVPSDIEVLVFTIEEFSRLYTYNHSGGKRTILLFSTIGNALRSYDLGFKFRKLNIGNVYNEEGKIRFAASIFLTEKDIRDLQSMSEAGVIIDLRCVPRDKPLNFGDIAGKISAASRSSSDEQG
ncbi:MAG: PTS sugar transporter subunit IIB [Syntrophales bacterium]